MQAKLEGGEAFATEEAEAPTELDETEDVSDLLAKLEASVKARRGGGGDSGAERPAKKAPATARKAAKKAPAKKAAAKKASTKR